VPWNDAPSVIEAGDTEVAIDSDARATTTVSLGSLHVVVAGE
jgi:hypothetical protein